MRNNINDDINTYISVNPPIVLPSVIMPPLTIRYRVRIGAVPTAANVNNMYNDNHNNINNIQQNVEGEKLELSFDDLSNKNEYQNKKDLIECPICLNILVSPVQCDKCNKCFCKKCINNYAESRVKCPFRCSYPKYSENKYVNNVLSFLSFKCNKGCGQIIKYDDIDKHYEEDCNKIDFKKKYKDLLKKYKMINIQPKKVAIIRPIMNNPIRRNQTPIIRNNVRNNIRNNSRNDNRLNHVVRVQPMD